MHRATLQSLTLTTTLLVLGAIPAAAQDDPRPSGWEVVFDDTAAEDSALFFVSMEPGWHITSGPASVLYEPSRAVSGDFRLEAEVYLFPGESDAGFGLVFGGERLESERERSYFQFLLRRDGSYTIAHRAGPELHVLTAWTRHDAVIAGEGATEPVLNTLLVIAGADAIVFRINDEEVARYPRSPGMGLDGFIGLGVGADLDLHVRSLSIAKSDAGD
jgi:hypothetical protein